MPGACAQPTPRRAFLRAGALFLAAPARVLAQPRAADTAPLRIVGPWEFNGIEPSVGGFLIPRLSIAETLLEADDAGRPLPGLAVRWSTSAAGRRWHFTLRPGARFHDGSPVTADVVARMLVRAAGRPGALRGAPIAAITSAGDDVVIETKVPFAVLPAALAHSSTQILAPAAFDARDVAREVVGSGPYRVVAFDPPYRMELAIAPTWDGPRPGFERVVYSVVPRAETRVLIAESGQADVVYALAPAGLARAARVPTLAVRTALTPRTVIVKVNAGHRWLADARARRAIALAIDRGGIARGLLRAPDLAATQLFPPTLADWHVPGLAPLAFDPGEARALLAALGWRPGPDGILAREGEVFRVTLRTFPDRPELPLIATAIQEQLRQVGIAVRVAIGNSSSVPEAHRNGSLELALAARNYAIVPDPAGTIAQDFGPRGGDWGAMNWSSPALVDALAALVGTPDAADARRAALRGEIARILQSELPVIPVAWHRQSVAFAAPVVRGTLDPLERSYRIPQMRPVARAGEDGRGS